MAKSKYSLYALGAGVLILSGCATDVGDQAEVGVAEQLIESCTGATAMKWKLLANLAVATAQEMGELNTSQQFAHSYVNGIKVVALSTYGQSVCAARGGCPMVQGLLDLQLMPNDVYVSQSTFNTIDYKNTLVDGLQRIIDQVKSLTINNRYAELPEDHKLTLLGQDGNATCGTPWYSFAATRHFHMKFSASGPINGMKCTQITEPNDPNGWNDNYLCTERDIGLKWSNNGVIAGMNCVAFNEGADPNGWNNNYLCTPEKYGLNFVNNGQTNGQSCVQINEPSDPYSWGDNFLCWDGNAKLLHPYTLGLEFFMFGGWASTTYAMNPYVDFVVSSDFSKFKIDPTDYTSGTVSTGTTGGVIYNMPYVSSTYSVGQTCYDSRTGKYGSLQRYPTSPNIYYCKVP